MKNDPLLEKAKAKLPAAASHATPETTEWKWEWTDWPEPPPERVMGKILPFRRRVKA